MTIALIVAMDNNGVIGKDNAMPWHLPADLKYFKKVTMGKAIIMGRKTFDSIGRALPGRINIAVTRQINWQKDGVTTASSLAGAIEAAGEASSMIIGGAEIYTQALSLVDRLYITEVDLDVEGDAYFPKPDITIWRETSRENHASEGEHPAYSFVVYDRI